jgi:hypothetical protein
MKLKQSVLAASITAALAMGAAGESAASVYAGSRLDIDALTITGVANAANTFNFRLTNTADLAAPAIATATCGGTALGGSTCGGAGAPLVLNASPANAPGSSGIIRADNDMTFFGPGGNYANSDSVINNAQLVGDASTDTDNVAESSLDSALTAGASSEIQSITGFSFSFTIDAPGSLSLAFQADPDMRAFISAFEGAGSSAQANLNTSFTLRQDNDTAGGTLGLVNWNPQGTAANDCTASGGPTCTEDNDTQDLNINVGATAPGANNLHSFGAGDSGFGDVLTAFGITVAGLDAGTWTLTLNEVKSVDLRRQVPEPGILALVGIGLLGLGLSSRRKKPV